MSDLLLIAVIAAAALACPLHMWWMNRRGRRPLCCPPERNEQTAPDDATALRARRAEIEAWLGGYESADRNLTHTDTHA